MMNPMHKYLTIAILAVSIFISGLSADLLSAQSSAPEPMVTLTPEEQAWLRAHPDVTFGFTYSFEPFLIKGVKGQDTGMMVDLLKALNSQFGTQFTLEVDSWPVILEKVKNKEMGAVLGVALHTADAFGLLKTIPYFTVYPAFFAREDASFTIKSLDDLRGKSVAILDKAKVMESILEPYGSDVDISRHPDNRTPLQMVFEGKADLAFGLTTHAYYINKYGMVGLKPVYTLLERPTNVGMAIRTDWPEFVSIMNKWLEAIGSAEFQDIKAKWIHSSSRLVRQARVPMTPEEQAWLNKKHTVRVRIADWPPYQIVKDNEPAQGIVIEYLKLIGDRTEIKFKYEETDESFTEFLDKMKQRKGPDMTAVIAPTPEHEQYLSFSETYLSSPYVIFIREQETPILDINGLAGKTIAVPRGFIVQEELARDYPEISQALFDSDKEALQAVVTGQADAYIGNLTVASHIIHRQGLSNLQVTAPGPAKDQSLSMGIRKDWPELTSIINKALASITEEEKTAIRSKYLAIKYEQGIDKAEVLKWVIGIGGAGLAILMIILFWNRRLSLEIRRRKQTELAFRQARDEAEAANQAKSFFLASMSHELRTPLNAVLGFSKMLAQEQKATADQKEKLGIINRSGRHLLSMVNDVLDLSKIEAGSVELQEDAFDLVALIEEISLMIQSRAQEKGLSVAVETGSISAPYVKTDMGKLRQILINLLSNAVKFTDEGGVTIRCVCDSIPEEPNRCHIVIEVEDTGPGIDPARQAQIFEPFVQGIDVPERKGTGLGLSICKRYTEFMGGAIELESETGKGSLFRLKLPAEIVEAAEVRTSVDDRPRVIGLAPTQKTWRILAADDNRENLLLLKSLLEEVGFVVLEAQNGQEAVATFKKEAPDFVWMDMRMPVMDGYEATRRIREWECGLRPVGGIGAYAPEGMRKAEGGIKADDKSKKLVSKNKIGEDSDLKSEIQNPKSKMEGIPIIAITASAFREQRDQILAAGCDDMVTKPFQTHEIFETMGRFLDIDYIYEPINEAASARAREGELTAAILADIPEELLQKLRETTLALNREAALEMISSIAGQAPEAAAGLKSLVDNYQMGELRDLLEDLK
ncbi:MAG: transporter substrate-binding domain-containing protein [Desulfobacterales bacterium]